MPLTPVPEFINKTSSEGVIADPWSPGLESTRSYHFSDTTTGTGDGAGRGAAV